MSSDNGKRSVTENFMFDFDSNKRKWKQYENETLYIIDDKLLILHISLHGLSGMKLVKSLETMGSSLKQGNRFENCTKLPHLNCFLIILSQLLYFFFALDTM